MTVAAVTVLAPPPAAAAADVPALVDVTGAWTVFAPPGAPLRAAAPALTTLTPPPTGPNQSVLDTPRSSSQNGPTLALTSNECPKSTSPTGPPVLRRLSVVRVSVAVVSSAVW